MKAIQPKILEIYQDENGKEPFIEWYDSLTVKAQDAVDRRLFRVKNGNFGDYKSLKKGLYELRFRLDKGYRIYFTFQNDKIVLLLTGGDKSTQVKDIKKARKYMENWEQCDDNI